MDQEHDFEVSIEARVRHAALWEAVKVFGSQRAYAEYLGVSTHTLSTWLNLNGSRPLVVAGALEYVTGGQRLSKFVCWEANRESKMLDVPRVNSLEPHQAGG